MELQKRQRENWIDAAKVISILIVVLNHSGLVIPAVNFWGGMFYVPAFFLLSGYTYTRKPISYVSFVKSKAKRLLVPYFFANGLLFLFFLLKDLLCGTLQLSKTATSLFGILYGRNQLIKTEGSLVIFEAPIPDVKLMLNLNGPTWFLPALFLVLISGDGLYRLWKGNKRKVNLLVALLAFVMLLQHYLSPFLLPWCLDILPYLLVFFLIGYELKEQQCFRKLEAQGPVRRFAILLGCCLLLAVCGIWNGSFNLSISFFGKSVALCLIAASLSSFLLMAALRWVDQKAGFITAFLGRMGKYTLTILCYHYFVMQMFFAAAEILWPHILEKPGAGQILIRAAGIFLSVGVCIVGGRIIGKVKKSG